MSSRYDDLTHEQLVSLLVRRDAERKLGLVWERNEIERDRALNSNFISFSLEPTLSCGDGPFHNMLIEGDNFDALRWLRMTMKGRIKCIYIDPPYNTGHKDWVYNDQYVAKEDRYRHSVWLEFLHQRLTLARDLLATDGVLMVSINDENRAKLELMLDEVLPGMRVGSMVWRTKDTANDKDRNFSAVHEHVLVYANVGFFFGGLPIDTSKYQDRDGDRRGRWAPMPITKAHTYKDRPNTYYPIKDPKTGLWYPCSPDTVWRYASRERLKPGQKIRTKTMEEFIEDDRIAFPRDGGSMHFETMSKLMQAIAEGNVPRDGNGHALLREGLPDLDFWVGRNIGLGRPSMKAFLNEKKKLTRPLSSWIAGVGEDVENDEVETVRSDRQGKGTDAIKAILGNKAFDFPKPPSLMNSLLRHAVGDGDTVLDFFAGSGTTAEAVMALNAEDGGQRRFIVVSSTEATEDEPDKNICRDVCAERIRRLVAGVGEREPLPGDFAYLRVDKVDFHDLSYDLRPADIWTAVQACHGLPLIPYLPDSPVQVASDGEITVAYCDKPTVEALAHLVRLAEEGFLIVYSWSPGRIESALAGRNSAEVRAVPDELIRRFQS